MIEDPITVVIGGKTWLCPPMPFYCLERAWPHVLLMGQMSAANQALATAQLQVRNAVGAEDHASATSNALAASALVSAIEADFVGQTREVIHIIVAALALEASPPSYDTLSKVVRTDEIPALHAACSLLLDLSGLLGGASLGEPRAMAVSMQHQNGAGSSLN